MTMQWKRCPKCGAPAELTAKRCDRCSHAYRTQFDNEETPPTMMLPPVKRRRKARWPLPWWAWAAFVVVAALFASQPSRDEYTRWVAYRFTQAVREPGTPPAGDLWSESVVFSISYDRVRRRNLLLVGHYRMARDDGGYIGNAIGFAGTFFVPLHDPEWQEAVRQVREDRRRQEIPWFPPP